MDFENMDIALSAGLFVGEGSDTNLDGAQLQSVVDERYCEPQDYQHMPFEEKLRLADVMIARWQRYRELVAEENSVPAESLADTGRYETLEKLTSDDGEDSLQAAFTPNNGIRLTITNADIGDDLAEFDLEPEQAKALGEALIRWAA